MKEKMNKSYAIIHGHYSTNNPKNSKEESDYFVKVSISKENFHTNYYIHLSDAMTPARWLEIKHLEREGFKGHVEGEILLHQNKFNKEQQNEKFFVIDSNSYSLVDNLSSGKEVRKYARRLVKAKTKDNISYDINDL